MIDLLEKTETGFKRVATASIKDVLEIGVRTFFMVQEILDRKIVFVKEGEHEIRE